MLQCNCSVLGDPTTREAIVLDPGDEVDRILDVLKKHDLKVRAILSTHTHIDHVGGLALLHQATGAPVLIHEEDLELYRHLDRQAKWLGVPTPPTTNVDDFLREGDSVRWGAYEARVLHTPGHTKGSISLYMPRDPAPGAARVRGNEKTSRDSSRDVPWLFAGDTLFAGSIGRTDLWGGSFPEIMGSIQEKLLALPDATIVYPGHGPATTIGNERASNPFLRFS
jgi:hydroxyacylglutathione hydrolase